MRKVKYFHRIYKDGKYQEEKLGIGTFIQYGCNYEEFESGPGNYTTAIIELDDGTVLNHPIEYIQFIKESDK